MVRLFRIGCFPTPTRLSERFYEKKVLLRSRFASEVLYMANGTGFGPVRVVPEYVRFDVASAAFGSFNIWHIEFLYTPLKDLLVSTRVVFILWLCRFLFNSFCSGCPCLNINVAKTCNSTGQLTFQLRISQTANIF